MRSGRAGRDGVRGFGAVTDQVWHERGDLERHLLTFRHRADGLALDEVQLIVPGIYLYASADRQRRDYLRVLLLIDRRRGLEISHDRHAVAEVRANQVRNFLPAAPERREEKACVAELGLIGRIIQELDRFRVGSPLLVGRPGISEMPESLFVVDQQLIEESITGIDCNAENVIADAVR